MQQLLMHPLSNTVGSHHAGRSAVRLTLVGNITRCQAIWMWRWWRRWRRGRRRHSIIKFTGLKTQIFYLLYFYQMENVCLAWLRLIRLVTQKPTKNRIWTARLLCAPLHHQLPRLTLLLILRRKCNRFLITNVNAFTLLLCVIPTFFTSSRFDFLFRPQGWPSGPVSSLARTSHNLHYCCCCSNMPHSNAATTTTTTTFSSSRHCCWLW